MPRWCLAVLATIALLTGCTPSAQPATSSATPGAALPALPPTRTHAGVLYAPADLGPEPRQTWLTRIDRTASVLDGGGLGTLTQTWNHRLAVELPATQRDYRALTGAPGSEAAAVTRCDPDDGSRITINPQVAHDDPGYLDSLLLHEAVHAATGSACTDAPLWVEEGLAEWFTAQHDPATEQANQQWLDHELAGGLPSGLPADDAFLGSSAEISGAYALAVFAVTTAIEHLGRQGAMAYFAAPDEVTTGQLTGWYLAGLQERLSVSARR